MTTAMNGIVENKSGQLWNKGFQSYVHMLKDKMWKTIKPDN